MASFRYTHHRIDRELNSTAATMWVGYLTATEIVRPVTTAYATTVEAAEAEAKLMISNDFFYQINRCETKAYTQLPPRFETLIVAGDNVTNGRVFAMFNAVVGDNHAKLKFVSDVKPVCSGAMNLDRPARRAQAAFFALFDAPVGRTAVECLLPPPPTGDGYHYAKQILVPVHFNRTLNVGPQPDIIRATNFRDAENGCSSAWTIFVRDEGVIWPQLEQPIAHIESNIAASLQNAANKIAAFDCVYIDESCAMVVVFFNRGDVTHTEISRVAGILDPFAAPNFKHVTVTVAPMSLDGAYEV